MAAEEEEKVISQLSTADTNSCSDDESKMTKGADTDSCSNDEFGSEYTLKRLNGLIETHRLKGSVSLTVVCNGRVTHSEACGLASEEPHCIATRDTIYLFAAVSKVVVGLAAARLMELSPGSLDLDADIDMYLKWEYPIRWRTKTRRWRRCCRHLHLDKDDKNIEEGMPITLRQLMLHEGAVACDYWSKDDDSNGRIPLPDCGGDLGAWLEPLFTNEPESAWEDDVVPGEESYSNVGAALAAHVIEKAANEPFEAFCRRAIFQPLGMDDTSWFFRNFDSDQRARVAVPFDGDAAIGHYSADDWPAGHLRSTTPDMAKLAIALIAARNGNGIIPADTVKAFESVPMFIEKGEDEYEGVFFHLGAMDGVRSYFEYNPSNGNGYVFVFNTSFGDDDDDDDDETTDNGTDTDETDNESNVCDMIGDDLEHLVKDLRKYARGKRASSSAVEK